jgi:hypothetical protein
LLSFIVITVGSQISKKEMKEYIRKNTPLAWFGDHPIVSAVLWILGHDMTKQKSRIEQYSREPRDPYSPNNGIHIYVCMYIYTYMYMYTHT